MEMDFVYEDTGEIRPPREGEWFRGIGNVPRRAYFDFHVQSFPILRMIVRSILPRVCENCGEANENVRRRLLPDPDLADGTDLCRECWADVQGGYQKERQEP